MPIFSRLRIRCRRIFATTMALRRGGDGVMSGDARKRTTDAPLLRLAHLAEGLLDVDCRHLFLAGAEGLVPAGGEAVLRVS